MKVPQHLDGRRWRPATFRPRMAVRSPWRAHNSDSVTVIEKNPGGGVGLGRSVRSRGERPLTRAPNTGDDPR